MFHVEFLIDDKHLAKMHHSLHGLRLFNLDVRPVVNAKVAGGKVQEANTAPAAEQFMETLRAFPNSGKATITSDTIKTVADKIGIRVSSAMLKRLVDDKQLRRVCRAALIRSSRGRSDGQESEAPRHPEALRELYVSRQRPGD